MTFEGWPFLKNIKVFALFTSKLYGASIYNAAVSCLISFPYTIQIFVSRYYSGEKVAPILTLFIGGNHEASNYLQELPYGGWVAPNIYYLGRAGVVRFGNLRIGG